MNSIKLWIQYHDDRWMFTILYVGLAIVLSLFISIFWLVVLVVVHGIIEWISLTEHGLKEKRLTLVIWHLRLDITLVVFALWLGVYIEAIFGLLGLGAAAKAGAQGATKFIAWQKTIKAVLLSLDDVAQVGKAVLAKCNKQQVSNQPEDEVCKSSINVAKWDVVLLFFLVALGFSIVFAPYLIDIDYTYVLAALKTDLTPWST